LLATEPWLQATDRGPRAVDAGACDRCGDHPRLLPTCGPGGQPALCRRCALEVGVDAWCDGHQDEARDLLGWAAALPDHVDLVITLWWVSTGEVRLDSLADLPDPAEMRGLPDPVRAVLGPRRH
jgi:hypothetical protein